jgi:hypothetical protein
MDQFEMLRQSGPLSISGVSATAGGRVFAGVNIHSGFAGVRRNSFYHLFTRLTELKPPATMR